MTKNSIPQKGAYGLRAKENIDLTGLSPSQPVYRARHKDFFEVMKQEMLYIVHHRDENPIHLIGHLYLFLDSLVRSSPAPQNAKGSSLRDFYIKEAKCGGLSQSTAFFPGFQKCIRRFAERLAA